MTSDIQERAAASADACREQRRVPAARLSSIGAPQVERDRWATPNLVAACFAYYLSVFR